MMKIIALKKFCGFQTRQAAIHLKGGCHSSKRIKAEEWREIEMEYDAWARLPHACVSCSCLSTKHLEKVS